MFEEVLLKRQNRADTIQLMQFQRMMELVVGTHCIHLNYKRQQFRPCKSLLDNFWWRLTVYAQGIFDDVLSFLRNIQ